MSRSRNERSTPFAVARPEAPSSTTILRGLMRRRKPVRPKLPAAAPPHWHNELRRESRLKLLRWATQAVALLVLFGGPYVRGRFRAFESQALYASVAACMYGGTTAQPATGPVADPSGHYAALFLQRSPDWPKRCTQALRLLAQEPPHLLFPSVKEAEVDVQKAAQILLLEIANLPSEPVAGAKIPLRPLWSLELLRAAVIAHAEAADVATGSGSSPVAFSVGQPSSPTPTLLDIDAAPDATVKLWGDETELQVAAFDRKAVSYIRLRADDNTRARLPRGGSLQSVVRHGSTAQLVWMTNAEKCGTSRCAGKSLGLAPMSVPLRKLPEPRWLAVHPFGSPTRSIAWQGNRLWVAAAQLDGTAKLSELDYRDDPAQLGDKPPPLAATTTKLSGARDLVVDTDSAGALEALALVVAADGGWDLVQLRSAADRQHLLKLPQTLGQSGWLRTCVARDSRYFAIGNGAQTLFGTIRNGVATTWPALNASIPAPARTDHDTSVALVCSDAGLTSAYLDAKGALSATTCERDQMGCQTIALAEHASSLDATTVPDGVIVAYSAAPEQPQVRLRRLDVHGIADAQPTLPGPCWERWGGMCGEPKLVRAGARWILSARSGPSLMALESVDAGATWSELSSTQLAKPLPPHIAPRALR